MSEALLLLQVCTSKRNTRKLVQWRWIADQMRLPCITRSLRVSFSTTLFHPSVTSSQRLLVKTVVFVFRQKEFTTFWSRRECLFSTDQQLPVYLSPLLLFLVWVVSSNWIPVAQDTSSSRVFSSPSCKVIFFLLRKENETEETDGRWVCNKTSVSFLQSS